MDLFINDFVVVFSSILIAAVFVFLVGYLGFHLGYVAARRRLEEILEYRELWIIPEDGFYFMQYDKFPVCRHYLKGDRLLNPITKIAGPAPEPGDIKI